MDDLAQLSDLQIAILRVLWKQGQATAAEVHQTLNAQRELAPTTVSTLLSRLERKGLVRHGTDGRRYIYEAVVAEREVRRSMLARLTDQFFRGDPAALVSHLIQDRDISPDELADVRRLVENAERSSDTKGAKR
jgi:BlaI family transcriptional regulator, penicillinase repressor